MYPQHLEWYQVGTQHVFVASVNLCQTLGFRIKSPISQKGQFHVHRVTIRYKREYNEEGVPEPLGNRVSPELSSPMEEEEMGMCWAACATIS